MCTVLAASSQYEAPEEKSRSLHCTLIVASAHDVHAPVEKSRHEPAGHAASKASIASATASGVVSGGGVVSATAVSPTAVSTPESERVESWPLSATVVSGLFESPPPSTPFSASGFDSLAWS